MQEGRLERARPALPSSELLKSPLTEHLAVGQDSKSPWHRASKVSSGKRLVDSPDMAGSDDRTVGSYTRDWIGEADHAGDPFAFQLVETSGHDYVELMPLSTAVGGTRVAGARIRQ